MSFVKGIQYSTTHLGQLKVLKVFKLVSAILGSSTSESRFLTIFGPSGHHNWPFLCQKGVIVISSDGDHPVPTFVSTCSSHSGLLVPSQCHFWPFWNILTPKESRSAPKWLNWFRYVSSKWISLILPYFYGKMLKKCKKIQTF